MGCDIHFHTEVKRRGKWLHHAEGHIPLHHAEGHIPRHYALFAKMAGVRNYDSEIEPISEPKGLPEDVTELTLLHVEKYGIDGHSHSWLSADEIVLLHDFIGDEKNPKGWFGGSRAWEWEHKHIPYFMGNHMDGFKKYPEDWAGYDIEDVRYVFFFDN